MAEKYVPKINIDALVQGYTGADPSKAGLIRGYLTPSGNVAQKANKKGK